MKTEEILKQVLTNCPREEHELKVYTQKQAVEIVNQTLKASQLSPSKGVEVPTDEEIKKHLRLVASSKLNYSNYQVGFEVAKWMRDRMLSLLSEKDKNIEEWKENFNTSIKLWEEERKKFQSELEAVKKERDNLRGRFEEAHKQVEFYQTEKRSLKSHADKMAEALEETEKEWNRQKGLFTELSKDGWMDLRIKNNNKLLSSYKTNQK